MYAADNDGKYPASLSELAPKYLDSPQLLEYSDPRTNQRAAWLYRKSLTVESAADQILFAAPMATSKGKRLVGFNDGSVKMIPEAEFQKLWGGK
jgi:hypothetical protein